MDSAVSSPLVIVVEFAVAESDEAADSKVSADAALAPAAEVDSPGYPSFFPFPNIDYSSSPSSSAEVVGKESVHSSSDTLANYGFCSIPSNPGLL